MALLTLLLDPIALAPELDEKGFICIENAIDPKSIERTQAYVHRLVELKGKRSGALDWLQRQPGHAAAGTDRRSADAPAHDGSRENRLPEGETERGNLHCAPHRRGQFPATRSRYCAATTSM